MSRGPELFGGAHLTVGKLLDEWQEIFARHRFLPVYR
jgi:hypothetical protein